MAISKSDKQITLFMDRTSGKAKQTLAYAKAEKLALHEVDVRKDGITGTQLLELSDLLDIPVDEMADKETAEYKLMVGELDSFSKDDWVKLLTEKTNLLKTPIAIKGNKGRIIHTPSDILKLNANGI